MSLDLSIKTKAFHETTKHASLIPTRELLNEVLLSSIEKLLPNVRAKVVAACPADEAPAAAVPASATIEAPPRPTRKPKAKLDI